MAGRSTTGTQHAAPNTGETTPATKSKYPRAVAARAKAKNAKAKVLRLTDMPMDVIYEACCLLLAKIMALLTDKAQILAHLHPQDLLHFARLTKAFQRLLMRRSAQRLWVATLKNVPDLPPKPDDMCEPAWVNLLFSHYCHVCSICWLPAAYALMTLRADLSEKGAALSLLGAENTNVRGL